MTNRGNESEALALVEGYLRTLCKSNWRYIEYDDRYNEVCLLFILAWRQLPTNSGHFLKDFELICKSYMDKLNCEESKHHFMLRSIDGGLTSDNGDSEEFSFYDILSYDDDHTAVFVAEFFDSLDNVERDIVESLLSGEARSKIARRHGMNSYRFEKNVKKIGERYLNRYCF